MWSVVRLDRELDREETWGTPYTEGREAVEAARALQSTYHDRGETWKFIVLPATQALNHLPGPVKHLPWFYD